MREEKGGGILLIDRSDKSLKKFEFGDQRL